MRQTTSAEEPKLFGNQLQNAWSYQETSSSSDHVIESHTKKAKLSPHSVLEEVDLETYPAKTASAQIKAAIPILKSRCQTALPGQQEPTSHTSNLQASKDSRWAERLLTACALAMAHNNILRTQHLMWVLNDLACHSGNPNQRLAADGLKSLFFRVTGIATSLLPVSANHILPTVAPRPVHRALLCFYDVSPWYQMVYSIANEALLKACEGHKIIHVLDIGISHGTQWPTFIEALAARPSGPPSFVKLTTVTNSLSLGESNSSEFFKTLEPFAATMGVKLELHTVSSSLESLEREDLRPITRSQGEVLVICAPFRLHQLLNESGSENVISPRNAFLKFLHELKPNLFVVCENDADHTSSDFSTRFRKAADFHWKFLDSTSASFKGRDCEERQIIEEEAGMAFHNNVAYEGGARIERNESHEMWRERMENAGFRPKRAKEETVENARGLLRKYDSEWSVMVDDITVVLQWKKQPTTFISLWGT